MTTIITRLKLLTESSVEIVEEKTEVFYTQDESVVYLDGIFESGYCSFESGYYLKNPVTGEEGRWVKGRKRTFSKTTMSVSDGVEIIQNGRKSSAFASYSNGGGTDGYRQSRSVQVPRKVVANYFVKVPGYQPITSIGIGETQKIYSE